jgi:hypothetical protein
VSQQINLFNPVFLKQKKMFSLITMLQGLVLIVLGSGLFYGYAVYQVKQLTKQSEETSKRYVAEQEKLKRYKAGFSPEQVSKALEDELKVAEARLVAQNDIVETLRSGVIGNTTGYSEYMRAFARQAMHGLWLTHFSIVGDATQMSLSGAVLSPELVPAYIRRLGQEKVMQGKFMARLQMQRSGDEARYVEFNLQSAEGGGAEK